MCAQIAARWAAVESKRVSIPICFTSMPPQGQTDAQCRGSTGEIGAISTASHCKSTLRRALLDLPRPLVKPSIACQVRVAQSLVTRSGKHANSSIMDFNFYLFFD